MGPVVGLQLMNFWTDTNIQFITVYVCQQNTCCPRATMLTVFVSHFLFMRRIKLDLSDSIPQIFILRLTLLLVYI